MTSSRTPPGVRELKRICRGLRRVGTARRTPPGVRELKLLTTPHLTPLNCRTPPGVRELKQTQSVVSLVR